MRMRSTIGLTLALVCLSQLGLGCRDSHRAESPDSGNVGDSFVKDEARSIHDRTLTLDSHAGFSGDPLQTCGETDRQVDFSKMRTGGLDAVFFSVFTMPGPRTDEAYAEATQMALDRFEEIRNRVEQCSSDVALARAPEELRSIVEGGRLAVGIGVEGGYPIGRDLTLLERFAELGMAYFGLTWDGHNALADAAIPLEELGDPPSEHGGVSPFGERVIAELNRLGVMVDVSHMSKAATLDAVRLSRAPVIASHSSMYGIAPHPRNLDDETLRALKAKGGVVQVTPVHDFIKVDPPGSMETFTALLHEFGLDSDSQAKRLPSERRAEFDVRLAELDKHWALASVVHFVDHIDYAVAVVGVDHVGIGSDFDGGAGVTGWMDATETANVTAELLRRGYTEEEIRKIWGGNLLRVWAEVRRSRLHPPAARTTSIKATRSQELPRDGADGMGACGGLEARRIGPSWTHSSG